MADTAGNRIDKLVKRFGEYMDSTNYRLEKVKLERDELRTRLDALEARQRYPAERN